MDVFYWETGAKYYASSRHMAKYDANRSPCHMVVMSALLVVSVLFL